MATKFTLVIPTYNESAIIGETIKIVRDAFIKDCPEPWHIIVADNASTDGTADIVDGFKDPRITTIRLTEKGRGRAIRTAFKAAGGGVVAFTDADLPIDPHDVIKGATMVLQGEAEIVVGSRFAEGSTTSKRAWIRRGSSLIFHLLAKIIVGLQATDSQCPLKITNERMTAIMLATSDPTWWSELEFLLLAEKLKVNMKELPITWTEERFPRRKSTIKVVQDGLRAIKAMFIMRGTLKKQLAGLSTLSNS